MWRAETTDLGHPKAEHERPGSSNWLITDSWSTCCQALSLSLRGTLFSLKEIYVLQTALSGDPPHLTARSRGGFAGTRSQAGAGPGCSLGSIPVVLAPGPRTWWVWRHWRGLKFLVPAQG